MDFARSHVRLLGIPVLIAAVSITVILASSGPSFRGGLAAGTVLGAALIGLPCFVAMASGSSSVTFGAWAERWTAEELREMQGHGYRLVNRARLGYGDIDHVLIGPAGVLVFETKWSSHTWGLDDPFLRAAVAQLGASARKLDAFLRPPGGVKPVVVLWGAAAAEIDGPKSHAALGVTVVPGHGLRDWLLQRGRGVLGDDETRHLHQRLVDQTLRRDEFEPLVMRSWGSAVRTAVAWGAAGLLVPALVTALQALVALGTGVALVIAGLVARRWSSWRLRGTALAVGAGIWPAVALVAVVEVMIR